MNGDAVARSKLETDFIGDAKADEFALSAHQLDAAKDPEASIHAVLAARQAGRPNSNWRNDPELARMINERLAAGNE